MLCGGGTGGHVYPLLAVRAVMPGTQWLFVGGSGVEQELTAREKLPYQAISGGGLHGVGWRQAAPNALRLAAGFGQAIGVIRRFRPDAILATGGFITVPIACAARMLGVPLVVYLPDIEPALSVRVLGRLATRVAATAGESQAYFAPRKFVVTGYPLRPELLAAAGRPRSVARQAFGAADDSLVVLVFGGSRGARSLNRAVIANAARLLERVEIIHISGSGDWPAVEAAHAALTEAQRRRYHIYSYLHAEMGDALAAADLVVSRAGASVLGEFPLFGLPAVLAPYPHAWRYQKVNADYLAKHGAAVIVRDEQLGDELSPVVERLAGDPAALDAMRRQARSLARPDAAAQIAQVTQACMRRA
ncbi:MAG: UDP-N-acetylglucosamine--N-acetylmuramyl-(pentapeptide) pyrophosphoryl-undecaprenol N-acetylglucosamine transferase [Chloroflexi bacterium]|nr:UDP-N-acetylglucosamine--N-acetylmuramyl-(pentapeptide) pyrophosphoryl-undecaprenol N-acetylglucosamine transferase [Chloroflexota bacterium]